MRPEHASRLAAQWLALDPPPSWMQLDGTAVLADLTGFTRLTEALAGIGVEGTEVLHRALTLCFSALLGPALRLGGDVIGFAGDAALVWFDGDAHERRAVESAVAMPRSLAALPAAVTGGKRIRVSVGVNTGPVVAMLVGAEQRAFVLCGPEISAVVALQAAAGPGQVVASASTLAVLPSTWRGPAMGAGFEVRARGPARLTGAAQDPAPATAADVEDDAADRCLTLLSPTVRALLEASGGDGDHRSASIGFVSVPGIDDLLANDGPAVAQAALHEVATTVARIATEHSITWLDVDVGPGGIKFLLAAGAPQSIADDELRLLTALRRMIDESSVELRAGAQRGRVFAGALGAPGRRTYTVIGDAVNVAARALGQAGDRELVAADGLAVGDRERITSVALGTVALKNRSRAVPLWRVLAVRAPHDSPPGSSVSAEIRTPERDRIAKTWKRAIDGTGDALTVIGEPGMGTSELLTRAAADVGPAATLVVSDPHRQQVPYATVAAIVTSLAGAAGVDAQQDGLRWLATFASHLTEDQRESLDDALAAMGGRSRGDEMDPRSAARRTNDVLVSLIEAAAPTPWLLAIEGLDAVDDASLSILSALASASAGHRRVVLASTRPSGPTLGDDSGAEHTIVLEPLDDEHSADLVRAMGPSLRTDQVDQIVIAARGNPFVLVELARHPYHGELPDSLERLGSARIDELPSPVRQLVRDASTFGATVPLASVAEVLRRPELADPASWTDAASVLRPVSDAVLAFRHDAYRLVAHASLRFQRRRELHSAIADHLAARAGTSAAVLAHHLQEAGRQREAFPLAAAAGRAARSSGALVEASDLLGRAAQMAREVDRQALGGLLAEQGEALLRLGDLTGAERAFNSAGRALRDPLGYAAMCSQRADLEIRRTRYRQARAWAHKGLSLVEPTSDRGVEVRGKLRLDDAAALHYLGRNSESLALANQALTDARAVGSTYLEGLAHLHLEMIHSALRQHEAIAHGDEAVRIFELLGHDRYLGDALINSGLTAMHAGRWDEALDRYRRAAVVVRRSGDTADAAIVELNEGFLLLRQGHVGEADALALKAGRVFDTAGLDGLGAYVRHLRARVAAVELRFAEAAALMAEARSTFERIGDQGMVVDCDVASIDRLLRAGRTGDALALASQVAHEVTKVDDVGVQVSFGQLRGLAAARAGDPTGGAARVMDALATAREHGLVPEIYLCLDALVEIETIDDHATPAAAAASVAMRAERDAIASSLGLVVPDAVS
jgi:class 3 adenylate cyclase/tetratricopeptide (TPR) repeat protein